MLSLESDKEWRRIGYVSCKGGGLLRCFGFFVFLEFDLVSAGWNEDKPKMLENFVELHRKFRTLERVQNTQQQTIDELVKKLDELMEKDKLKAEEERLHSMLREF